MRCVLVAVLLGCTVQYLSDSTSTVERFACSDFVDLVCNICDNLNSYASKAPNTELGPERRIALSYGSVL